MLAIVGGEGVGSFKQRDQAHPDRYRHYPESDARLWPGIAFPQEAISHHPSVVVEAEGGCTATLKFPVGHCLQLAGVT